MPSKQLSLGPMKLQSLKSGAESVKSDALTGVNSVNAPGVTLAEVILTAGLRIGMQKKELAALFELSPPDFTVAFDVKEPKRNRLMKVPIPLTLAREIALQLCEATGLAVSGPDAERTALGDLLAACAQYVRVHQR